MSCKRVLKLEVADGIRKVRLGAYSKTGEEAEPEWLAGTALVRTRMPGGVGGRRGQPRLLPDPR